MGHRGEALSRQSLKKKAFSFSLNLKRDELQRKSSDEKCELRKLDNVERHTVLSANSHQLYNSLEDVCNNTCRIFLLAAFILIGLRDCPMFGPAKKADF